MCGITGILNLSSHKTIEEDLLFRMISILRHRGPDESGAYLDKDIALGHSRLQIIGLTTGIQPISNEDETLWIVYNGEVFNYLEIRAGLEKKGHRFRTQTDTEVVLHLYEEFGSDCLSELNGQFAFAIWDSRKKELFLARDRVGICPLYYTFQNGRLLFASEIKAIFQDPSVPRIIDLESLDQVFTCWTTVGSRSIFRDIYELCPGNFMVVKAGEDPVQRSYWTLPFYLSDQQWSGTVDEAAEELRSLLEDAVRLRLRADVPVGAYLSGGLDSSVITSIISGKFNNRLKTFSLGFEEKSYDEAEYQSEMVAHLGTDHHHKHISNRHIRDFLAKVIWHCEKPLLRTGPVPLYLLSQFVRDNQFKVVLTGEGADEIFGGYNIFKEAKIRSFWGRRPESKYRPLLLERLYPYIFQNVKQSRAFMEKFFSVTEKDLKDPLMSHQKRWKNTRRSTAFFHSDVAAFLKGNDPMDQIRARLPENFARCDILSRAQWLEIDIFMSNYLLSSQGDRVAMANAVELRPPFLDHRLIEFAAKLPSHWKINGLNEKYILKKAFREQIPENIVNRPKQPYRVPIRHAFFNPDGDNFHDLISSDAIGRAGLFDLKKVANFFDKYLIKQQGPDSETYNMAIVGILSTQMIYEQFIESVPESLPVKPDKIIRARENNQPIAAIRL